MTFEEWLFFMAIWIAASVPLGPNALNCISAVAANGFARGLWSVVGVTIAAVIHMSLAVTGMAAFLAANPAVFEALRWLGVAYLAWMGVSMLRSRNGGVAIDRGRGQRAPALIGRAITISLSNPKAIFAWMAVFSQFIDPAAPLAGQLLVLAPSALAVTVLVYGGYCVMGTGVERVFAGRRKFWFDRGAGATYLGFAAGLAFADMRRS